MSTHLQPNPDLLNKQFKLKDQAKPVNPELEKKRLGFKSLIHKDPSFDNYLQYLKFLDAHTMFKKQFNRVLKDFLTAFRRDETVKRKLVYLEYWLRLENEDIYQYVVNINELLVNEIGTSFPVLYSTWFKGLEAKGNLKEAEKALMLGVEKTGDDKLIKMLNDFKQNLEDRQDLENSRSASNKAKGKSKVLKDGFKLTSGQPKISSGNKPVPDLNDVNAKEAMSDILSMFNTTDDVSSCGKMDVDCQDKMKGVFIYKPEDDETISRQVFQRKTNKLRIGVFHDEIDDGNIGLR